MSLTIASVRKILWSQISSCNDFCRQMIPREQISLMPVDLQQVLLMSSNHFDGMIANLTHACRFAPGSDQVLE